MDSRQKSIFLSNRNEIFIKKTENRQKNVYISPILVYNNIDKTQFGGAPDSIAGERKDKHTADGVPAQKHSN